MQGVRRQPFAAERRDRALIAFAALTVARAGALASFRLGHVDLAGADQRNRVQPEPARGDGRELGVQVGGGGEDAAHDVLGRKGVSLHHGTNQLLGALEDRVGVVRVDGYCAA